jgi:hypothetical protein
MVALAFDTLKAAEDLRSAGVPDDQAKAIIRTVQAGLTVDPSQLATKADLAQFATKADLQAAISDLRSEITRWMFGVAVGQVVVIGAMVKLL